jgi:SAM-dependent methyltransferase
MRALAMVGSDIDHFECPICGSHDRERHLLLYLNASGIMSSMPSMRILHFAPERGLSRLITAAMPIQYVKCDLHPVDIGVQQADIEAIPFAGEVFDLVIANHVLEHVDDDLRAVREICRVLRPGGTAILQTPYSAMLQRTWSDAGIKGDEPRRQAYGQEDHARLFGLDIFERFSVSGFLPCIATHSELLPGHDADRFGVNGLEPFFRFRRAQ